MTGLDRYRMTESLDNISAPELFKLASDQIDATPDTLGDLRAWLAQVPTDCDDMPLVTAASMLSPLYAVRLNELRIGGKVTRNVIVIEQTDEREDLRLA